MIMKNKRIKNDELRIKNFLNLNYHYFIYKDIKNEHVLNS